MDTKYALIQACKDSPEDDTPRLILADWLEEHGDASDKDRGRFLRLSCARGQLGQNHPDEAKILAQIHELLQRNRGHWLDPILQRLNCGLLFHKGLMIASVNGIDNQMPWLKELPKNLSTDPVFAWLEGLRIITWRPDDLTFLKFLRDPRTNTFSFLHIDNPLWQGTQWNALTKVKPVLRVKSSQVYGLSGEGYGQALANCPIFEEIRSLNMESGYPPMDDGNFQEFCKAPWLSNVTHLNLPRNRIGPAGLKTFLTSQNLVNLEKLNLACNPIGDQGAELLAKCPGLEPLAYLDVRMTEIGPQGAKALAKSPFLRNLNYFSISRVRLGEAGAAALAESPIMAKVHTLSLGFMCDSAASPMANSPHLGNVQTFNLGLEGDSKHFLAILARSSALPNLGNLIVDGCALPPDVFFEFVSGTGFKIIRSLTMNFLRLGSDYQCSKSVGLNPLLDEKAFPLLHYLDLGIPVDSLPSLEGALKKSLLFRRLRRLKIAWHGPWTDALIDGFCNLINEGNLEDISIPAPPEKFMKRLVSCAGLNRLLRLRMWTNKCLGQRALKTLVTSDQLNNLALLDLQGCEIGDAIKVLPQAKLPSLVWLDIHKGAEQDEILRTFSRKRPEVYLAGFPSHSPWRLDHIEPVL